jgi:hypothetical protein
MVSVWYNVPALDLTGVKVMSVTSVQFDNVDLLDPNDRVECGELAEDMSSEGSLRCDLRGG